MLKSHTHCVCKCCSYADTSTAGRGSKFGEALTTDRLPLITAAFVEHSWLTALHGHVGSQGCSLDMLVAGARALVDFALHVNAAVGQKQVRLSFRLITLHVQSTH
jgi:diaminopimelate decarboxylase